MVHNLPKIQELWRATSAPKDYVDNVLPMGIKVSRLFQINANNMIRNIISQNYKMDPTYCLNLF